MRKKAVDELNELLSDADVRRALIEAAGENTISVIETLRKASEDEEIANILSLKVSDVRSVLNKLSAEGFAFYERSKDEETGWYSYYWSIDLDKFREWIHKKLFSKYENLRLKVMEGEYYYCTSCGMETVFSFEDSFDYGFKCPSCSSALELLEEEKIMRQMKKFVERKKAEKKLKKRSKKTKKKR